MKVNKVTIRINDNIMPKQKIIIRFLALFLLINNYSFAQDDSKLKVLIDNCEEAMGGKKAYDNTRHITWQFFGFRTLYWDKFTGDVRIEVPKEKKTYLINVNSGAGKVMVDGTEIQEANELAKALVQAKNIWINDSYWLVMPFKLNDPGVNKRYLGTTKTTEGVDAEVIELTFEGVGVTPDNKYHIFFDPSTKLVCQWSFYKNYEDEKPSFEMPWKDYNVFDKIKLSGNRGERSLDQINVFKKLPQEVYTTFAPVNI